MVAHSNILNTSSSYRCPRSFSLFANMWCLMILDRNEEVIIVRCSLLTTMSTKTSNKLMM